MLQGKSLGLRHSESFRLCSGDFRGRATHKGGYSSSMETADDQSPRQEGRGALPDHCISDQHIIIPSVMPMWVLSAP